MHPKSKGLSPNLIDYLARKTNLPSDVIIVSSYQGCLLGLILTHVNIEKTKTYKGAKSNAHTS